MIISSGCRRSPGNSCNVGRLPSWDTSIHGKVMSLTAKGTGKAKPHPPLPGNCLDGCLPFCPLSLPLVLNLAAATRTGFTFWITEV